MMRIGRLGLIAAALSLAGCLGSYALVPPQTSVAVADSPLRVTPGLAWNRAPAPAGPGKSAELWTRDGALLNELTFYGGIADGKPLFREVDKRERPLPRFRSTMLPQEIVELVESSYRVASGSPAFTVARLEPMIFAGRPGFRFDYEFVLQGDEVKRKGRATGAVIDGRLYLMTFEAPAIHYFGRDIAEYERIVASAKFG